MASSQQLRPTKTTTTASASYSKTESGAHIFTVRGHSRHRALGFNRCICSTRFTVGGHDWRILYYPDGYGNEAECKDYVGVQLELMSDFTEVRLEYEFSLALDQAAMELWPIFAPKPLLTVLTAEACRTFGTDHFMKKEDLENSMFLRDDCLVIYCIITVIREPLLTETAVVLGSDLAVVDVDVEVPPSTLSSDLGRLFSGGKDADIKFKVGGEVIPAHKVILHMRCPALKTQQLDDGQQQMRDNNRRTAAAAAAADNSNSTVIIEDMEPTVFKALLQFIYTGSLKNELRTEEMAKNLMEAANRYAMERMKLYCGRILSERLTVQSVSTIIAIAHKHCCRELKDACIQFIISSERRTNDVFASDGFKDLKANCPAVVLEILDKSNPQRFNFNEIVPRQQPSKERLTNGHDEAKQSASRRPRNKYSSNHDYDDSNSDEEWRTSSSPLGL